MMISGWRRRRLGRGQGGRGSAAGPRARVGQRGVVGRGGAAARTPTRCLMSCWCRRKTAGRLFFSFLTFASGGAMFLLRPRCPLSPFCPTPQPPLD